MESLVFLLIMFLIGGVLQSLGQKNRNRRGRTPIPEAEEDDAERPKDILQAIREAMEAAERERASGIPRPMPQAPTYPRQQERPSPAPEADSDLFEEETTSLETEPEIRSLEIDLPPKQRPLIDRDEEIEAVVSQRIEAAELRDRPTTAADHQAFDAKIRRKAPQQAPSAEDVRHANLRQAVLWNEILGKPKSLRD